MAGKSAIYYKNNPAARKVKNDYAKEYNKTPAHRAYRSKLAVLRVQKKLKGSKMDLSHARGGRIVLEHRSRNRARQGSDGKSTLK